MSMTAPLPHPHRISRQLTVSVDPSVNVRPVVKGAIQEAAHTLTEAYNDHGVLAWCCRGVQDNNRDVYFKFFKTILNAATLSSRDYVVQADGCKGVLVWSCNGSTGFGRPSVTKLAKMIGWMAALRAVMQYKPWQKTWRKQVMAGVTDYLVIDYLGVLEPERRKGNATALVQHLKEKANSAHLPILVEVMAQHEGAITFFKQQGFQQIVTHGLCDHDDLPVAFMVREPNVNHGPAMPLRLKPGRHDSDSTI
ncbi:hypothetical protein DM01DRAFT_1318082 [Hesseltinella vesiculosa]|uniref:N-acetyltransferase domain-containing protein n=1 Tax=Hesseltinella vesiculosa TaxID=101127 RepID=A0A1X2GPH0_9FUNG|nr:hypothetical protein DM01DRAFT_1318082 [Hesseltinella vesiculosa]